MLNTIKHGLIVSCQAEGNDPFNTPEGVSLFAAAAEMGGARGIRTCGLEKAAAIVKKVKLPVVGLTKAKFNDGYVKITRNADDVHKLFNVGCAMVAIDGTLREWDGMTGPEFIKKMKAETGKLVMADISTIEDALACVEAGADCLSTTLSGYTPDTEGTKGSGPDIELLKALAEKAKIPVIAEGRISSPEDAKLALDNGAWAVVVGTVLTRPRVMTGRYVEAMEK